MKTYNGEYIGPEPEIKVTQRHLNEAGTFEEELLEAFHAVEAMHEKAKFDGRIIYANYSEIIEKFGPWILVAAKKFWEEKFSGKS